MFSEGIPQLHKLQTTLLSELDELLQRAFAGVKEGHHHQVEVVLSDSPRSVVGEEFGRSGFVFEVIYCRVPGRGGRRGRML